MNRWLNIVEWIRFTSEYRIANQNSGCRTSSFLDIIYLIILTIIWCESLNNRLIGSVNCFRVALPAGKADCCGVQISPKRKYYFSATPRINKRAYKTIWMFKRRTSPLSYLVYWLKTLKWKWKMSWPGGSGRNCPERGWLPLGPLCFRRSYLNDWTFQFDLILLIA